MRVEPIERTILWRRLDAPGHDACALRATPGGWRLEGTAVFLDEGRPCHLAYAVDCDAAWRTRAATVAGWMGRDAVALALDAAPDGEWRLNGVEQPEAAGLVDLDLGFTPATNLPQLRRLALAVGQAADAPVAYLHFPALTFGRLAHRYHRLSADRYAYEAPRFGYAATLHVDASGFVTEYPGLWTAEATG